MTSETEIDPAIDLMMIVVAAGSQKDSLIQSLSDSDFHFTIVNTEGGLFYAPTNCFLIGINKGQLGLLLELIGEICQPTMQYVPTRSSIYEGGLPPGIIEAKTGGAVLFAVDVEEFFQI